MLSKLGQEHARLVIGGLAWICVLVVMVGAPGPVLADGDPDETSWGYALAHEMMSPFCPGRTISACTSPQAAELRQWILLQESAGASREEVVAILEERYGDAIRSTPEAEGWGLAAWMLPAVALAIGAAFLTLALRRMVGRGSGRPPEPAASSVDRSPTALEDEDLIRRVDRELAARDR